MEKGSMISAEAIALIALVISIIGSIIIPIYQKRKENEIDIRVTINKILDNDALSWGERPMYTILAKNFGKRTAHIDSARIKLQCLGREYPFRSLKTFNGGLATDISIPYDLLPGCKLETSVDYWEIYKFVQDSHKSHVEGDPYNKNFDLDLNELSSCKLIADFEDQLGKIFHSNSIYI